MKKSAIIVAGGIGTRMNAGIPKQFLILAGKPLLMHSMAAFSKTYPDIDLVLALPPDQFGNWDALCKKHDFNIPHQLSIGGQTRFHSVQQALQQLSSEGLIAIHDGVRPLISETVIRKSFETAKAMRNCIPLLPITESIRKIDGEQSMPVDRSLYRIVQTPQVFLASVIKKAYEQSYRDHFTDDAVVAESAGETIHFIPGDPVNLKITHPNDLAVAEYFIEKSRG